MARLGDVLREVTEKTTENNQYPVLTSSKEGIFLQQDYFNKQVASKDNTGYKIIHRGQFTYRAMSDTGQFFPNMLECTDIGIVSPAYPVFEIADASTLVPEYLKFFFKSECFQRAISLFAQGSTRTSLKFEKIKTVAMNFPDSKEQRRVVITLNKLTDLISLRRQQLAKLEELVKARFLEMFGNQTSNNMGWEQTTVGACCELKSGTSLPAELENEGGHIPYIKVGDMSFPGNEYYITTSSRYVTEETAGKGIFPKGTVIFPKRGGAIGTNKKRLTQVSICADLNIMGVIAGNRLLPSYLMTFFEMIDLGSLDNGSSVPQINNKDIAPLAICLPPINIQENFSNFAEWTYSQKLTIQQSLDKLELLKKSLMQEYFG